MLQDGTTALQIASLNGHTEVVQLLLDSRADANLADEVRRAQRPLRELSD
jgi:ankyrin repeat protein